MLDQDHRHVPLLLICFASLPSLWSARCRPGIRVWTQLLMLKVNAALLAVFGE